jgi:predicted Ser/Thr protein kinase
MTGFVTDDAASDALNWLLSNAKSLGKAKEKSVLAESMTKRIKALEMARSDAKTVAEKERDALASEAYLLAITAEAQAAGEYETMRALKDAATARIECWRSLTSTARALKAA